MSADLKIKYFRVTSTVDTQILYDLATLINNCAVIIDEKSYVLLNKVYDLHRLNQELHLIISTKSFKLPEKYDVADFSIVTSLEKALDECQINDYEEAVIVVL